MDCIYTDGSSYSNPRIGGFAIRFVSVDQDGNEVVHDYAPIGYRGATNQQMELMACIEALNVLNSKYSPLDASVFGKLVIYTDSMYVVENYPNAVFSWSRSKWLTRNGTPVANAELWKNLVKQLRSTNKRVEFKWVKGHKISSHNKAVDKLAKVSARQASRKPLSVVNVRRKITSKSVKLGSVRMSGQRLTIRIISDEYLRVQRCYKYKYEVMSKASPYFQSVDIVYSDILMSAGHSYYVKLGVEPKNPRISKVYGEKS